NNVIPFTSFGKLFALQNVYLVKRADAGVQNFNNRKQFIAGVQRKYRSGRGGDLLPRKDRRSSRWVGDCTNAYFTGCLAPFFSIFWTFRVLDDFESSSLD